MASSKRKGTKKTAAPARSRPAKKHKATIQEEAARDYDNYVRRGTIKRGRTRSVRSTKHKASGRSIAVNKLLTPGEVLDMRHRFDAALRNVKGDQVYAVVEFWERGRSGRRIGSTRKSVGKGSRELTQAFNGFQTMSRHQIGDQVEQMLESAADEKNVAAIVKEIRIYSQKHKQG